MENDRKKTEKYEFRGSKTEKSYHFEGKNEPKKAEIGRKIRLKICKKLKKVGKK